MYICICRHLNALDWIWQVTIKGINISVPSQKKISIILGHRCINLWGPSVIPNRYQGLPKEQFCCQLSQLCCDRIAIPVEKKNRDYNSRQT